MHLKFISGTETLFDEDIPIDISDECEDKINQFNDREVVSYTIEFVEGVRMTQAHSFDDILDNPELVKILTIKIK